MGSALHIQLSTQVNLLVIFAWAGMIQRPVEICPERDSLKLMTLKLSLRRRSEHEIDVNRVVAKDDHTFCSFLENTCFKS